MGEEMGEQVDPMGAEVEARMDDLLALWAEHRELDAAGAGAIQRRILAEPRIPGPEPWLRVARQVDSIVRRATLPSSRFAAALASAAALPTVSGWTPRP